MTNFPIERTYEEWKNSVYAQAGIQCQDCHMMPVEKAIEAARTMKPQKNPGKASSMGPDREQLYTHEFVGANFTVPTLLGQEADADNRHQAPPVGRRLSLEIPPAATPGTVASVKVKVTNDGAGHNLPTSLTEVREMWLDVSVKDANGAGDLPIGRPGSRTATSTPRRRSSWPTASTRPATTPSSRGSCRTSSG